MPVLAGETADNTHLQRYYFFSGIDVARDTSYGWAGAAWAPFGPMDREGLRLRAQAGGGGYRYRTNAVPGGWNSATKIEGEVLAGWQFLRGPHALALYAGVNVTDNRLDQPDPSNRDQGTQFGIKGVAEWFYRIDDTWIWTASLGGSTADGTAVARATLSRRVHERAALGTEAQASTDWLEQHAGAGLFIEVPLAGRQWRVAGGWRWSSDSDDGPYGTVSYYAPF
ncbi:cellulose biosynthesis protein BcsS [Ancylobacter sp. G4_0304]|uniref:cellulose biosynthesis protein BcsS n=1 Tax=Ancylobacter sp. G4_0304 TaxID=3114289 RepID=UPI0039C6917E